MQVYRGAAHRVPPVGSQLEEQGAVCVRTSAFPLEARSSGHRATRGRIALLTGNPSLRKHDKGDCTRRGRWCIALASPSLGRILGRRYIETRAQYGKMPFKDLPFSS
jgi:hypothetical protein